MLFRSVLPQNEKADNFALMDSIAAEKEKAYRHKILLFYDFENQRRGIDSLNLSREQAYSGSRSFKMYKKTEFSPGLEIKCSAISSLKKNIRIRASAFLFFPDSLQSGQVLFVVSLEEKNQPYQYEAMSLNDIKFNVNQWTKVSFTVHLKEIKSYNDIVKVYLWDPGKKKFYLDDFKVEALIPNMTYDK